MSRLVVILLCAGVIGSLSGCASVPGRHAAHSPGPQQTARDNWLNPARCSGAGGDCGIR